VLKLDNRIGLCYDFTFSFEDKFEICYYDLRNNNWGKLEHIYNGCYTFCYFYRPLRICNAQYVSSLSLEPCPQMGFSIM
jgi:hypothetical protein